MVCVTIIARAGVSIGLKNLAIISVSYSAQKMAGFPVPKKPGLENYEIIWTNNQYDS